MRTSTRKTKIMKDTKARKMSHKGRIWEEMENMRPGKKGEINEEADRSIND
jgi:hypothetical protein